MSSKSELVIWSCDTDQLISCFNSCQLTITCMSNIKNTRCKPRPKDLVLTRWGHAPSIHAASHIYHEKRVAWASISMFACDPVPIVMGLSLAALESSAISTRIHPLYSLPLPLWFAN